MNDNVKTSHLKTPGDRLDFFIVKYFGKQITFGNKAGLKPEVISRYVLNKKNITTKVAIQIQETTGLNADFLLDGNLPIVLNNSIEPLFEGNVPKILHRRQDTKLVNRRQMQLTISGANEVLKDANECNIIEFAFGSIKMPIIISVISPKFCSYYNMAIGTLLVVSEEVEDGNVVLIKVGRNYKIVELLDNNYIDYKTKKQIVSTDNIELIGAIHAKVERF